MHQQNVKVIHSLSFAVFIIAALVRISHFFIDYQLIIAYKNEHTQLSNYFLISSFIVIVTLLCLRYYNKDGALSKYNFIALIYAAMFIGGCLWISFLAQANPKNTMTLLMLGLFMIGVLVVLSFLETILIIISSLVVFTIGLDHFQPNYNLWMSNYIVFCVILVCFYFVSRLLYSYHANYFIKVKTIEDKNEEIILANHAKDEILSIVAHDLRSPIANIQSLIELIQSYEQTNEEREICYNHIKDCCVKADVIIREIVTAAKEENAGLIKTTPLFINEFLTNVYNGWHKIVSNKREITLILPEFETQLPLNKEKFQRVLDNLISNAIKFTTEENGQIEMRLEYTAAFSRISIRDNGIGIPKKHLASLFDKFTSAGRQGLKNEPSVGLGLNISKLIVEQHKGHIWVRTEENKGSCFYIDLPLPDQSILNN